MKSFKHKIKKTTIILTGILCGIIVFSSCDTQEKNVQEIGEKIEKHSIPYNQLIALVGNKEEKISSLLSKTNSNDVLSRDENFIQYIDTTKVLQMVTEDQTSFTVRIVTNDEGSDRFYNMTIYQKDGGYDTAFFKYLPDETKTGFDKIKYGQQFKVDENGQSLENSPTGRYICGYTYTPVWICSAGNYHTSDDFLSGICIAGGNKIVSYRWDPTLCDGTWTSNGGGSLGSGTPTSGGGISPGSPDVNNTGGVYGNGSVYTTPVLPTKSIIDVKKDFLRYQLTTTAQKNWWNSPLNGEKIIEISFFMFANQSYDIEETPTVDIAEEMVNCGMNNTLVSVSPFFKFELNSNYATTYPNFTSLVKDLSHPYFTGNTKLKSIIYNLTGVSQQQIAKDIAWGQGATIKIQQLGFDLQNGVIKGKFDPHSPNEILIDVDLVNAYESAASVNPNSNDAILIGSLIVYAVLMHELVHYEDYQFDTIMINNPELGLYFEELFSDGYWEFDNNGCVVIVKP